MTDATSKQQDTETDDFEIEVVDDTPEEDKGRPRRAEGAEPDLPTDDDLEGYSESVKKRISKLKYEFHEERRQREEASRLRDEAVAYAQRQHQEAETLRKRLQDGDAAFVSQAKERVKSQLAQVQARMKAAYEAGDSEAFVQANTELADIKSEESRLSTYRPAPPRAPASAPPAAVQQPTAQAPKPSPRAEKWAQDNTWFGKDEEMTALAFGVHERAVRQGIAPDSDAYYTTIDAAIRQRFPDKFAAQEESTPRRQPGSVVAPGGRSTAATPRKITLTSTQVALAKKLGLTNEQYAAQLIKEQKNG